MIGYAWFCDRTGSEVDVTRTHVSPTGELPGGSDMLEHHMKPIKSTWHDDMCDIAVLLQVIGCLSARWHGRGQELHMHQKFVDFPDGKHARRTPVGLTSTCRRSSWWDASGLVTPLAP